MGSAPLNCSGDDLRSMMAGAAAWLERYADEINALNVFPVPDGDTGTNMLLTLRAMLDEAQNSQDTSAASVSRAMARGALLGARGNSGVILSQIVRGLARALDEKHSFGGRDWAEALEQAARAAYKAVSEPVEGTMLTVARDISQAARRAARLEDNLLTVMRACVEEAKVSVQRTPHLLPILKEAGVVDAGGHGLCILLCGAFAAISGDEDAASVAPQKGVGAAWMAAEREHHAHAHESEYGYCTEFLLEGTSLPVDDIRRRLEGLGDSVLVVGDETQVRAHVHTFDPGAALSYGTSLGSLLQVKVDNMQRQHVEFVEQPPPAALPREARPIGLVAVATGAGLTRVFESLGATVVPGGPTLNPSTEEILRAVEEAPASEVIVLPNNKNVVMAAEQVRELSTKNVRVVPSVSIPQGIAALLAHNFEQDLASNVARMEEALRGVVSGEVTRAVRAARLGEIDVRVGDYMGLVDDVLKVTAPDLREALEGTLRCMGISPDSMVTIYWSSPTDQRLASEIADAWQSAEPQVEFELVEGGQPHYNFLISVE